MSIEKALNFADGFGNYSGDAKPTTYADMYRFMGNQNNVLTALASLIWQPSTAYKVGDVVAIPGKSYLYLECTTAGTTATTEPTLSSVTGGAMVTDGTVKWAVRDKRMSAMVDMFYPVGSVYMTVSSTKPAFMSYGTWTEVASDKVLQGASSSHAAGSTVAAGLPNITGSFELSDNVCTNTAPMANPNILWHNPSGAFISKTVVSATSARAMVANVVVYTGGDYRKLNFSAQGSNTIYGNSNTVQPPAYIVHVYQRTA